LSVPGVSGAFAVAAGSTGSFALVGDPVAGGTVRAWGGNLFGMLGLGTTSPSLTPAVVLENLSVASPIFSQPTGAVPFGTAVFIACGTPGSVIHYTTNGQDPTESDPTVTSGASITIDHALVLKARAFRTGWNNSVIKTAYYTDPNNPTSLQFTASTLSTNESSGQLNINVTRSGDVIAPVTVDFATTDAAAQQGCSVANGKASARCDYIGASGTLVFASGETSKTISILIIDDAYVEGGESFDAVLSNPSGAALGTSTTTVTINDNDSVLGQNPIDQSGFFVDENYFDFLNRAADPAGRAFWISQISSCGSDPACIEVHRINVSASFFLSIEFQNNGYLVERFYKVAYGSATGTSTFNGTHQLSVPVIRFAEFLKDTQRVGKGVVVLQSGWEQLLENNKQAYALEFVQTSRFINALPISLSPSVFVDQLNANAGNVLSANQRTAVINLFGGAGNTGDATARAQAVRMIAEDTDLYNAEYNRAFVLAEYFGYLRRNPNDAPDSDYTGYDFWLTKLNQFNGNYINAEMVKAFLSSIEYRQRFGP
jgi:hypothetical protein